MLAHFGLRITPRRVFALCRDLGAVCERNRARGEPELAVLVVRKSDRLPGEGFFHSLWRDGAYDGPATGPAAAAFIRRETERVFAHWAGRHARTKRRPIGSMVMNDTAPSGREPEQPYKQGVADHPALARRRSRRIELRTTR